MKPDCLDAITNGKLLKTQGFNTPKGMYGIALIRHKGDIYFVKYLNRKLVECCNLSQLKGEDIK